jgi:hypothetical protein
MDETNFQELATQLGDYQAALRSGSHWGNSGGTSQPRRMGHPLAGVQLGIQDAQTQARIAAEYALSWGGADMMPRLKPGDGTFATLLYPTGKGAMEWHSNYHTLGQLIEPAEWRNRQVLLEWNAFAGLVLMVCVPEGGQLTQRAKRKTSHPLKIIANDFRGIYLDGPFTKADGVFELAASFAFPIKAKGRLWF